MKPMIFHHVVNLLFLSAIVIVCFAKGGTISITVTSPAFGNLQEIPQKYTCDGSDVSPPLTWSQGSKNTKCLVLICDDPDAPSGTWVHWVCYDIPPNTDALAEAMPKTDTLACGGRQGKNDFGRIGWGGPCPPGGTHRYFFKVYCLDIMLNLPAGKTKKEIEKAMKGHIMNKGEFTGVYSREH
jgi:Raf kinase inhibitor-like YbhB/YbcL family protein